MAASKNIRKNGGTIKEAVYTLDSCIYHYITLFWGQLVL
jgi:hypothetical protein